MSINDGILNFPDRMSQQEQPIATVRAIYADLCRGCGVCCVIYHQRPFGVPVDKDSEVPKRLIQIGPRRGNNRNEYMRAVKLKDRQFTGGGEYSKCIALEGRPRQSVQCGIYEIRPRCCSRFDPGSPACVASREWASMEVPEDMFCVGRS